MLNAAAVTAGAVVSVHLWLGLDGGEVKLVQYPATRPPPAVQKTVELTVAPPAH